jgi:hypothetical protein
VTEFGEVVAETTAVTVAAVADSCADQWGTLTKVTSRRLLLLNNHNNNGNNNL